MVTVAEVLLLFLNSMPEPIIPYRWDIQFSQKNIAFSLYELCINNSDNANIMKQIKSNFKPECQTLFEYITSFLRELASNQGQFTFRKNAQKNKKYQREWSHRRAIGGKVSILDAPSWSLSKSWVNKLLWLVQATKIQNNWRKAMKKKWRENSYSTLSSQS